MSSRNRGTRALGAGALVAAVMLAWTGSGFATEQAQQRRDARDVKQDTRQDAREEKVDCRQANQQSNAACRRDTRDTRQDGRQQGRDIKY